MNDITLQIMQHNLQALLRKIGEIDSHDGILNNGGRDDVLRRNWAFDFYLGPQLIEYSKWLEYSDETSNFTYGLRNLHHLAGWVDCVTGCGLARAVATLKEIIDDSWLVDYVQKLEFHAKSRLRIDSLGATLFGRRIGWYAVARLKRPRLIVETGVDRGMGAAILCRALMLNARDGYFGSYIGTDINPQAGYLLREPLSNFGEIRYGDSIESLSRIDLAVDLFINDSDHSADYEAREYESIAKKLGDAAVVLGDNSHVTSRLFEFAERHGLSFLHFQEQPKQHWYPGAGIGAAFRR